MLDHHRHGSGGADFLRTEELPCGRRGDSRERRELLPVKLSLSCGRHICTKCPACVECMHNSDLLRMSRCD